MSTTASSAMSYARTGRNGGAIHIDGVTIAIVLSIALLGLVMVTSASVSIALVVIHSSAASSMSWASAPGFRLASSSRTAFRHPVRSRVRNAEAVVE